MGVYYMTEEEARAYMKISDDRKIPTDILSTRFGLQKVFLKKDIDDYMLSRKR